MSRHSFSLLAALLILCACGGSTQPDAAQTPEPDLHPVTLPSGGRLRVVSTTNVVGDVVRQVGRDRIDLVVLMGVGVDPHTYSPTPADLAALFDAHVVFVSGAGLEEGLDRILDSSLGAAAKVDLSHGLELQIAPRGLDDEEEHAGEAGEATDPHVWLNVRNVLVWVDTIEQTLSTLDPANRAAYQENARTYRQDLTNLDTWIRAQVEAVAPERRKLVTNHLAFGYFARAYGFVQLGAVYPLTPASQPSAQQIAQLQDLMRASGVPALFTESSVNPALAEQVAQDTGARLVPLYSESLGGPGSGAESYVDMMRTNVLAIVQALQ